VVYRCCSTSLLVRISNSNEKLVFKSKFKPKKQKKIGELWYKWWTFTSHFIWFVLITNILLYVHKVLVFRVFLSNLFFFASLFSGHLHLADTFLWSRQCPLLEGSLYNHSTENSKISYICIVIITIIILQKTVKLPILV